jgi:predicted metal-dependent phosphoesterase TrpH
MIDLHLHTTASDGTLAPADLVRRARDAGLSAIALTDHDTMAGLTEARRVGKEVGVEVVAGVEISIGHSPGTFHLIGLFVDPADATLAEMLGRIREGRGERNERLAARLTELNLPLTVDEVRAYSGGGLVARPHFAAAMVANGYVRSIREAFDLFIGKGRTAYVERYRPAVAEAIAAIHGAGGVTVLCHPHTLGVGDGLDEFVAGLAGLGLDAIETRYKEPAPTREGELRALAWRHGLLESGGSDFHGHTRVDERHGLGSVTLDTEHLEALRQRAAEHGSGA